MSLITKMYVEDKEINILDFKFRFTRSVDESGKPMGKPNGTLFDITFETTADQSFFSWAIGMDMVKKVKITVSPVTQDSKTRVLELYDVHCVYFKNHFNGINGQPMTTHIRLTPAILYDGGVKILEHYWKETDLSAVNTPVTSLLPDTEPEFLESFYEDKDGKRIPENEVKVGDNVYLVLKTRNAVGQVLTLDLKNNSKDFEFNGQRLEQDLLENVSITSDLQKLAFKIIEPQKSTN
ncbi:type VI secretion system tube protein TssD [Rapidithrix thailandica]|uniref:Type VI secretion system tube protein TssD n=1 Tax=Rapidithrix thailandica TaxID=413964 RepID=A0AAW9RZS0_9BACT